jgi:hypothetical protein
MKKNKALFKVGDKVKLKWGVDLPAIGIGNDADDPYLLDPDACPQFEEVGTVAGIFASDGSVSTKWSTNYEVEFSCGAGYHFPESYLEKA